MATVKFEQVFKRFGRNLVIKNLNLIIKDGEFVTLVGPSGCGKTTTLRMVAGLEDITSGKLYIDDIIANDVPPQKRGLAMVFQSYALFPHMTVAENIGFGLKIKKYRKDEIIKKIKWAIELLNLDGLEERLPRELSGGQRQRVALARALVLEPKVLLLDEPLSNLDAKLRLKMRAELKRIHRKLRSTVIYVTHDQVEAMSLSDKVAIMNEGSIFQVGRPTDVYNLPENLFVAGFIGSPTMNFFDAKIIKKDEKLFIEFAGAKLLIPKRYQKKCANYLNKDVIFGIRPENIYEKRFSKIKSVKENTMDVIVDVVEPLGDRDMVEVTKEGIEFSCLLEPEAKVKPDELIKVVFDLSKSHIFDKDTKKNIIY
ncbi:MAG: ABC transporter ATP-binding protein [Deltaproteobacteria bacterium]|nr:ABC transporter ATP-binding protein [Deltaproteobacteria bacterium]